MKKDYDNKDDIYDISESLKSQVNRQIEEEREYSYREQPRQQQRQPVRRRVVKKKKHRFLKGLGVFCTIILLIGLFLVGTKPGRKIIYRFASKTIYNNVVHEDIQVDEDMPVMTISHDPEARGEDYVTNYLIFGVEEIGGARNTDSMMIASINTKDNTVKLTSLLRDTYVDIPGKNPNKLNSAFAKGGASLLIQTIEKNYKVQLDGYAYVNFKSFEKIVDALGGVDIELGEKEANYLNRTNYISNPKYRNVKPGMNHLNGNQALGYCRVRKIETLGGARFDYGRTLRQRRVLQAMFDKYKSLSVFKMYPTMKKCLGYVKTNLSQSQMEKAIENIMENKIRKMDTFRIPVDGEFDAPVEYNGITYPIVVDWDANIKELYKFIFLD